MPRSDVVLQRMREVLGKLITLSNRSRVDLGEHLGGGPHLVRRILSGDSELKARHIIEIAELIGIRPMEFFRIVFEDEPAEPSPLIRKMGDLVAELDAFRAGALNVSPASRRARRRPPKRPRQAGRKAPPRSK